VDRQCQHSHEPHWNRYGCQTWLLVGGLQPPLTTFRQHYLLLFISSNLLIFFAVREGSTPLTPSYPHILPLCLYGKAEAEHTHTHTHACGQEEKSILPFSSTIRWTSICTHAPYTHCTHSIGPCLPLTCLPAILNLLLCLHCRAPACLLRCTTSSSATVYLSCLPARLMPPHCLPLPLAPHTARCAMPGLPAIPTCRYLRFYPRNCWRACLYQQHAARGSCRCRFLPASMPYPASRAADSSPASRHSGRSLTQRRRAAAYNANMVRANKYIMNS